MAFTAKKKRNEYKMTAELVPDDMITAPDLPKRPRTPAAKGGKSPARPPAGRRAKRPAR
jgi:hypothetical protein